MYRYFNTDYWLQYWSDFQYIFACGRYFWFIHFFSYLPSIPITQISDSRESIRYFLLLGIVWKWLLIYGIVKYLMNASFESVKTNLEHRFKNLFRRARISSCFDMDRLSSSNIYMMCSQAMSVGHEDQVPVYMVWRKVWTGGLPLY